jgi:hypothetical protein
MDDTARWHRAAALFHALYSPECVEYELSELRPEGALGDSRVSSRGRAIARQGPLPVRAMCPKEDGTSQGTLRSRLRVSLVHSRHLRTEGCSPPLGD